MRVCSILRSIAILALVAAACACGSGPGDDADSRASTPSAESGNRDEPPGGTAATDTAAPSEKVTLASGVAIQDLVVGTGTVAERGKSVVCHATGWLTTGKQFWSTVGGDPVPFRLQPRAVIPGFLEGVTGMRVGGKRKIWIPSKLGYGKLSQPKIPPDSDLIFEVEVVDVK